MTEPRRKNSHVDPDDAVLLNAEEAAKTLRISRSTFYDEVRPQLPRVEVVKGRKAYRLSDIKRYIAEHTEAP